jgi:hypothetical protein
MKIRYTIIYIEKNQMYPLPGDPIFTPVKVLPGEWTTSNALTVDTLEAALKRFSHLISWGYLTHEVQLWECETKDPYHTFKEGITSWKQIKLIKQIDTTPIRYIPLYPDEDGTLRTETDHPVQPQKWSINYNSFQTYTTPRAVPNDDQPQIWKCKVRKELGLEDPKVQYLELFPIEEM